MFTAMFCSAPSEPRFVDHLDGKYDPCLALETPVTTDVLLQWMAKFPPGSVFEVKVVSAISL